MLSLDLVLKALLPALGVGVILGLLGAGGSILTVPILVYLAHLEPKAAIASALVVVGVTSAIAAWQHSRRANVRVRVALTFSLGSLPFSFIGGQISRQLSSSLLIQLFAFVMMASALGMLFGRREEPKLPASFRGLLLIAMPVGLITGVVGAGGGFLIVPALVLFGGIPMKDAVGTSLVAIALNCIASLMGKWGDAPIAWSLTIQFTALAIVGSFFGQLLSRRLSGATLKRAFAFFVLGVAIFVLVRPV